MTSRQLDLPALRAWNAANLKARRAHYAQPIATSNAGGAWPCLQDCGRRARPKSPYCTDCQENQP